MHSILVNEKSLNDDWVSFFGENADLDYREAKLVFFEIFKRSAVEQQPELSLFLKTNAFEFHIKKELYDHLRVHAMVAAILNDFNEHLIPTILLSTLITTLIKRTRIEIVGDSETIYLELCAANNLEDFQSPKQLYASLPDVIKEELNFGDFENLMNNLVYAGLAASKGSSYLIHQFGKHKIRIHFVAAN